MKPKQEEFRSLIDAGWFARAPKGGAVKGITQHQQCILYDGMRHRFGRALGDHLEYVYFIQRASGAIKIGYSKSPVARLSSLRTSSHDRLELLFAVKGSMRDEAEAHKAFDHLRLEGEWFESAPDLWQFMIESCAKLRVHHAWFEDSLGPITDDQSMIDSWDHIGALMRCSSFSRSPYLMRRVAVDAIRAGGDLLRFSYPDLFDLPCGEPEEP